MEMRARANSSVGPERLPYKQEVAGSNPASPMGVAGVQTARNEGASGT